MKIQLPGAQKRPSLSPDNAAMASPHLPAALPRRSPTLSIEELRREVALMVG